MVAERKERLPSKEKSIEQKGEKVNKVEIDRVIDEIFALFNKPRLRRIWTPHQLYFKFMEFLPKRRSTKDDVLSVSFRPPNEKGVELTTLNKRLLGGNPTLFKFFMLSFCILEI